MTFVGIDPSGLAELGALLGRRADVIERAASGATDPLHRLGRERAADRVGTRLTSTAHVLRRSAGDFRWRIDAVLNGEPAAAFSQPWAGFALHGAILATARPIGAGPPAGPVSIAPAEVVRLVQMTPQDRAAYFASHSYESISVLAAAYPAAVSSMDGAPPRARYAASDLVIARRIAALGDRVATVAACLAAGDQVWFIKRFLEAELAAASREIAELELWLAEDRQILLFDPAGDGRVAEVFGDLERARNIGVVVPGITNDRANFSDGAGGFRANARNLHDRARELDIGDVATVAWLGYDTPDGVDAVLRRAADEGHGALVDFVAGMDALPGNRHLTVVGHSYGSLVAGLAAAAGLAANEVVFVGSPGTGLDHADEAELEPGGVVWAGLADGDPIGAGIDIAEFLTPAQQLDQTVRRLLDSLDGEDAIRDLHHGTNPTHEDFGAIEIHTDGSVGHSDYFKPGTLTLDNLVYIIAGMDPAVSIEVPEVIESAPGPFGGPLIGGAANPPEQHTQLRLT